MNASMWREGSYAAAVAAHIAPGVEWATFHDPRIPQVGLCLSGIFPDGMIATRWLVGDEILSPSVAVYDLVDAWCLGVLR